MRYLFYSVVVVLFVMLCVTSVHAQPVQRQAIVTVVSWASPIGHLNGTRHWQKDRYNYNRDRANQTNRPLDVRFDLPTQPVPVGSDAYMQLQYQGALEQLALIKQAHFDVAAYNMLPYPDYDPVKPIDAFNAPMSSFTVYQQWVQAAQELGGVQIGMLMDWQNRSGDYPKGHHLTAAEWVKCIKGTIDHLPSSDRIWKIDGKPVLMHFNTQGVLDGLKPGCQWETVMQQVRANTQPFYDVADIRPNLTDETYLPKVADAVYIFGPAGPSGWLSEAQTEYAQKHVLPYIWTVSPGYYNRHLGPDRNKDGKPDGIYTQFEFSRIHDTYLAAIKADARYLNVLTWNDLGEDTDIWPSANKGDCLLKVFGYYNQWFKSGKQPTCDQDTLILAYPRQIPDQVSSINPAWGAKGKWAAPKYEHKIYYWANLTQPRKIQLNDMNTVDLPAGLSMGEMGHVQIGAMMTKCDGQQRSLPAVEHVTDEHTGCGLQYRMVDLTAKP